MRKKLRLKNGPIYLLVGLLALMPSILKADVIGAEIQYRNINDSLYIYLNTFENYAYGRSANINSKVIVTGISTNSSYTLDLKSLGIEDITPICKNSCTNYSSKSCGNPNTLVKRKYMAHIYLGEFASRDCQIKISWESYRRPGTWEKYYLESLFDRCVDGGNTSPEFVNTPYHILSLNETYSYSWQAIDTDGDSLVYELSEAKTSSTSAYTYDRGLNYKSPFYYYGQPQNSAKFPKGFHFNSSNGLLRFIPVKTINTPVVVTVSEYRDGQKIGESVREVLMTVKNVANKKPIVSGINGSNKEYITACIDQEMCFYVQADDGDAGDDINFTWETDIPNASVSKKSGKESIIQICWTPSQSDFRPENYSIRIIANDNSCELTGKYERIINVKVAKPFNVKYSHHISSCKEITFASETNFNNPNKLNYEWQIGEEKLYGKDLTYNYDIGGKVNIKLIATDDLSGCNNQFSAQISLPKEPKVSINGASLICPNTSAILNAKGAKTYEWFNAADEIISNKATLDLTILEDATFILKGTDKYSCVGFDTIVVETHIPLINIIPSDYTTCKGIPIEIMATGADNYTWSPNGLKSTKDNSASYSLLRDENVIVSGIDKNGCFGKNTVTVHVDQDCVWPGDVNGDEKVNNKDVLYLGISYNSVNPASDKDYKTPVWQPYKSSNWTDFFSDNRNYKHADANNDGIIDFADLMVIDKFYSKEAIYTNKKETKGYKLYFDYNVDSLKDKEIIEINISLGTEKEPAKDIYGIAFTIDYNNIIDTGSISFNTDNSWLAEGSNTIKLVKNIPSKNSSGGGKIDIAYSRTSKKPKSGSGKVGSVKFVVQDDIDWKKLHYIELMLEGIEIVNEQGEKLDAYGESASIDLTGLYSSLNKSPFLAGLKVYPNPVTNNSLSLTIDENHANVNVSIISTSGQTVLPKKHLPFGNHTLDLTGIQKGYYLVVFETQQGIITTPIIVE